MSPFSSAQPGDIVFFKFALKRDGRVFNHTAVVDSNNGGTATIAESQRDDFLLPLYDAWKMEEQESHQHVSIYIWRIYPDDN